MAREKIGELIDAIKADDELREVVWHERIRAEAGSFTDPPGALHDTLASALKAADIERLYTHQAKALNSIREGENVVVMTPTASGKSLIYNLAVLEEILKDPKSTALYIFPLKGLIQDQIRALNSLNDTVGLPNLSAIYDGDTSSYKRRKIREDNPNIIFTNPDMIHLAINPFHEKWADFFRNLKFIVIDEIHTYRGVFGSHVAHVIRRMRRIASHYGSEPVFIASSATISNPLELASNVTGIGFTLVNEASAPAGKKNFIFLNPVKNPHTVATKLLIKSIRAGFRTICFTRARKVTELMHKRVKDLAPEISGLVSSYRAGFLAEERRDIERRLFSGKLMGVISTSALELGVDIGGLDVCILTGYPGTVSSTWQRAGRAGRSERESLTILVALNDALDQYFMRDPEDFFSRGFEAALLDTGNQPIRKAHLLCAATEIKLTGGDTVYDLSEADEAITELTEEGSLRYWKKEGLWYSRRRNPQKTVNIRETGTTYRILDEDGRLIGSSGSRKVFHELHPGALYLHMGKQYIVLSLHTGKREVTCRAANVGYYTVPETTEDTEIVREDELTEISGLSLKRGMVRVTEEVTGYWRKDLYTREIIKSVHMELPTQIFTTAAIWMEISDEITEEIAEAGFSVPGSLHALEHAQIATLPLFAICDRMDLGGVSYDFNPDLGSAAIFIYDGHEGGIGLTHRGFSCAREWFTATLRLMEDCPCEVSCPSCTQDPHCGNANDPLDKRGAIYILKRLAYLCKKSIYKAMIYLADAKGFLNDTLQTPYPYKLIGALKSQY